MTPRLIVLDADEVRELLDTGKIVIWREVKMPTGFEVVPRVPFNGYYLRSLHPPDERMLCCPHGQPGQRLWIRERFSTSGLTRYHDTGDPNDHGGPNDPCCAYAADATYRCGKRVPPAALAPGGHKWCSPVTMHRRLSRPWLVENVGVRVEQEDGVWKWRTMLERVKG